MTDIFFTTQDFFLDAFELVHKFSRFYRQNVYLFKKSS